MQPTTVRQERNELTTPQIVRKVLLICGILSSLLYVGADILAAMQWEGYSYTSQAVSELGAVGAPTRPLLYVLFGIYEVLVIAFGVGILVSGSRNRALRITGILLIIYAIAGQVTFSFFPMNLRGSTGELTSLMHLPFTALNVLALLLSVVSGASIHGKRFRIYSIGTLLIILLFAVWVGFDVPEIAAGLPTPWHGIKERINIYGYMQWVLVLAISLLRTKNGQGLLQK